MKRQKKIPEFTSAEGERTFWAKQDAAAYVDFRRSVETSFTKLKPASRTISIRIPEALLASIKVIANRADVPYQSMMKVLLQEKVEQIRRQRGRPSTRHDRKRRAPRRVTTV